MTNIFYLPDLADGQLVRYYLFQHPQRGPYCCVLVSKCRANSPHLQYAHVMYVYEQEDFITGGPCFAVASEVNRTAAPDSGCSHFLGMFPGGQLHLNLGAADDWADIEKFACKALDVIVEHFSLSTSPEEAMVPPVMLQRFQVPRPYALEDRNTSREVETKKWWQFWK